MTLPTLLSAAVSAELHVLPLGDGDHNPAILGIIGEDLHESLHTLQG